MDIKSYYQSLINQIEMDKEKEVNAVKSRILGEKIIPYNQQIDKERLDAINKRTAEYEQERQVLTKEHNEKLSYLSQRFEQDKKIIVDTCEEKKTQHLNSVLATETYEITSKADKAVANLKGLIDKIKE